MSNFNWTLVLNKFLISHIGSIGKVITYYPPEDTNWSFIVLDIDDLIPTNATSNLKVGLRLHLNNVYSGNKEIILTAQKLIKHLTDKRFEVSDEENKKKATLYLKYERREQHSKLLTYKFVGLLKIL